MEELIQQYIKESSALIDKQAEEIKDLVGKTTHLEKALTREQKINGNVILDKQAAENTVDELINCLSNGTYTQKSIVEALQKKDAKCLEKQASEVVDDDWGELDQHMTKSSNLRPSEEKLYSSLGLI